MRKYWRRWQRSKWPLLLAFVVLFPACEFLQEEEVVREPVARVHDQYLYETDLEPLFQGTLSPEDSLQLRENFILDWVRQQLILQKALSELPEEQQDKQQELKEYYHSLIRYEYDQHLVRQRLDTMVAEDEIRQYYEEHRQNFLLKTNIIKFLYLKVPVEAPSLEKVKAWYKEPEQYEDSLLNYAVQYAANFNLDTRNWYAFDDILKEVPIETYDQEHYLQNHNHIELQDSSFLYLINILGFRVHNEVSPLDYERENIRDLILRHRSTGIIKGMERQALEEGRSQNFYEIYREE